MAAVELKKQNWFFNKKFETWFQRLDSEPLNMGQESGALKEQKYRFFDYENGWTQRTRNNLEMDVSQIENELQYSNAQPFDIFNSVSADLGLEPTNSSSTSQVGKSQAVL